MKINVKVLKKKKKSTNRPKILIFPLEGKQTYFFFGLTVYMHPFYPSLLGIFWKTLFQNWTFLCYTIYILFEKWQVYIIGKWDNLKLVSFSWILDPWDS